MDLIWHDLHHSQLNTSQLYHILALRNAVFIVEQRCAYLDIDGADLTGENRHLLGLLDDRLVAYARILAPESSGQPVKIGRVIVSGEARGLNLGSRLMEQAMCSCEKHWGGLPIFLSAQAHLQRFYRSLGFTPVSEEYLEDGIAHIDMQRVQA